MRQLLTRIASSTRLRAHAPVRSAGLTAHGAGLAIHAGALAPRNAGLAAHGAGLAMRAGGLVPRGDGLTPRGARRPPHTFNGAVLPICGVEVLIVVVRPWVLADIHEANLFVVAFYARFRRTIVLMAQRPDGAPRFYGPTEIVRVLLALPLELIPWRRLLFRTTKPPSWQLPIPQPRVGGPTASSVDTDDVIGVGSPNPRTTVR